MSSFNLFQQFFSRCNYHPWKQVLTNSNEKKPASRLDGTEPTSGTRFCPLLMFGGLFKRLCSRHFVWFQLWTIAKTTRSSARPCRIFLCLAWWRQRMWPLSYSNLEPLALTGSDPCVSRLTLNQGKKSPKALWVKGHVKFAESERPSCSF